MANITVTCTACQGTGQRETWIGGEPSIENPCSHCLGSGKTTTSVLDDTKLDEILAACEDMKDKCDDILDKLE